MTLTDITNEKRTSCVQLQDYKCGLTIDMCKMNAKKADIQRALNIPKSTGTGLIKKRAGRALKLSERDQRAMVESFREEPFLSFVGHNRKLKAAGIDINIKTLIAYAARHSYGSYSPAYVPKLTPKHMEKRFLM